MIFNFNFNFNYERWAVDIGYTQYWQKNNDLDQKTWNEKFVPVCKEIIKTSEVPLGDAMGNEPEKSASTTFMGLICDNQNIIFNGIGADSHETFHFSKQKEDFSFCKTARKPYDKVVVAILKLAEHCFEGFSWSSDGNDDDHKEGTILLVDALTIFSARKALESNDDELTELQNKVIVDAAIK